MNRVRYNRLIEILNTGNYKVDIKKLCVISNISKKSKGQPMIPFITTKNRLRVRLTHKGTRYEYELHEIISVWMRKCVVDMRCIFLDGDPHNCHPGNLYWSNMKGGKRPDLAGEKSNLAKLTKKQVKEIRIAEFTRNRKAGNQIDKMAKELGVSRWTIINIRQGKSWERINLNKKDCRI